MSFFFLCLWIMLNFAFSETYGFFNSFFFKFVEHVKFYHYTANVLNGGRGYK